jgi:predicted nucleotidyltransferase
VILFGSYASGTAHKHSDIDIAVVSPDFENKDLRFKADIFSKTKLNCSIDVDIHPFTDKALKNVRPTNFMGHILKTGTVIFKNGVLSLELTDSQLWSVFNKGTPSNLHRNYPQKPPSTDISSCKITFAQYKEGTPLKF